MSTEDSLALAKSYSESARRLEELSQQLSREASYAETHGMQMSQNLSQELANWYRAQQAANPGLDAPELWATDLTPQQRQVREGMIARWMHDRQAAIRAEIQGELHEPNLVDVHGPGIGSAADVERSYHPHGVARLPAGPGGGDPGAAARVIAAGNAETDDARAAAQSMRAQRVQGNVDLQGEVNQGLDHDFFRDPKLRQ